MKVLNMVHYPLKVEMTKPQPQKIPLVFFRSAAGTEPVRDWLKDLDEHERHAIGLDLMRVQWRWPVGMPLCRPMGQDYGKCVPTCQAIALPGFCFAHTAASW